MGMGGNQAEGGLMQMVLELVDHHPDGLQGLVQKFADAGLAQHVQSWVGTGANLPILAERARRWCGVVANSRSQHREALAPRSDPGCSVGHGSRGHQREQEQRVSPTSTSYTDVELGQERVALQRPA
jgi:hypothetical protein